MLTSGARVAFGNLRSSSFVAFGASSLSLLTPAGAAVFLTPVVTTERHVGGLGCWGVEGSRWRVQPPGSAGRRVGRVSVNVRVADLDLLPHGRFDKRKIEVVADGLPLFMEHN